MVDPELGVNRHFTSPVWCYGKDLPPPHFYQLAWTQEDSLRL